MVEEEAVEVVEAEPVLVPLLGRVGLGQGQVRGTFPLQPCFFYEDTVSTNEERRRK